MTVTSPAAPVARPWRALHVHPGVLRRRLRRARPAGGRRPTALASARWQASTGDDPLARAWLAACDPRVR